MERRVHVINLGRFPGPVPHRTCHIKDSTGTNEILRGCWTSHQCAHDIKVASKCCTVQCCEAILVHRCHDFSEVCAVQQGLDHCFLSIGCSQMKGRALIPLPLFGHREVEVTTGQESQGCVRQLPSDGKMKASALDRVKGVQLPAWHRRNNAVQASAKCLAQEPGNISFRTHFRQLICKLFLGRLPNPSTYFRQQLRALGAPRGQLSHALLVRSVRGRGRRGRRGRGGGFNGVLKSIVFAVKGLFWRFLPSIRRMRQQG
mmetsp:Transcript_65127/g.132280  ORF Transcript_65127/g.132280 Transcript_65127/m.132280 type:complete len:259 (-) Transcript_65127:86-862(-)